MKIEYVIQSRIKNSGRYVWIDEGYRDSKQAASGAKRYWLSVRPECKFRIVKVTTITKREVIK